METGYFPAIGTALACSCSDSHLVLSKNPAGTSQCIGQFPGQNHIWWFRRIGESLCQLWGWGEWGKGKTGDRVCGIPAQGGTGFLRHDDSHRNDKGTGLVRQLWCEGNLCMWWDDSSRGPGYRDGDCEQGQYPGQLRNEWRDSLGGVRGRNHSYLPGKDTGGTKKNYRKHAPVCTRKCHSGGWTDSPSCSLCRIGRIHICHEIYQRFQL